MNMSFYLSLNKQCYLTILLIIALLSANIVANFVKINNDNNRNRNNYIRKNEKMERNMSNSFRSTYLFGNATEEHIGSTPPHQEASCRCKSKLHSVKEDIV